MSARRAALTKGRLQRDRLDLEGRPGTKALVFRGPRGFGKSVQVALCAEAALSRGEHCIYLDLDSPRRGSLSEAEAIADAILGVLAPTVRMGTVDAAELAAQALAALASDSDRVTICLDDVGGAGSCGRLLEALVLETPKSLRLVIAARETTNLTAVSLLPGVETVGPAELAFDRAEAERLTGGDAAAAEAMLAATGGWPALCAFMQMTARTDMPLESLPETRAFFETEILAPLETPLRDFLLNASVLETITPAAYDYVFKARDAERAMIRLAGERGLLTPVAATEPRYALAAILRRYLRERFTAEKGDRRSYVLRRVAFWHWRRREYREAINAALRARDHRWAQTLSADIILDLTLRQGEIEAAREWLDGLPHAALVRLRALSIGYAWTLYFNQRAKEAEQLLTVLKRQKPSRAADADDAAGWAELVRAIGKATHDEPTLSEKLCREWLRDYGARNTLGKGAAMTCLAFVAASDRRFDRLDAQLAAAASVSGSVRHRYAFGWLAATRILATLLRGDMVAARVALNTARHSADVAIDRTPFTQRMLACFAIQIASEDMSPEPDKAREQDALAFAMDYGVADIAWSTVRCCAENLLQSGKRSQAFSLVAECRALARERGLKRLEILAQLGEAGLALACNVENMNEALPEAADLTFSPNHNRAIQAEIEFLRAASYLREQKAALAERYARMAVSNFSAVSDRRGEVRAQYVLGAALHLLHQDSVASRRVVDADLLTQQLGCFGTLRNTRALLLAICPPARSLLDRIVSSNPVSVTAAKPEPFVASRTDHTFTLLSSKQLGILQHATRGLTNKEIAECLYVTEDAVKWHFRKIFRLLAVTNRTQAVAEARERGLV